MHLTNYSYFDYGKNLNTPNLSPCRNQNGTGSGILGVAGLVVWYLTSEAQGPWINTWLGYSRLDLD